MKKRYLWSILADRRFLRGPVPLLLVLAALNLAVLAWSSSLAAARQENLLLASYGTARPASSWRPNPQIRHDRSVGEDLDRFWSYIPDAREQPLVLLAGMSQMYSINEVQPGDQTIVEWLDDTLRTQGIRAFGLAAPNLDNEEALFLLLAGLSQSHTRPSTFIYAVCFDKMRNLDLRPGYQAFMRNHPGLRRAWQQAADEYAQAYPLAAEKMRSSLESAHLEEQEAEDSFEARVRHGVGRALPMVKARKELQTAAMMSLFHLRNKVLGITPTTKRHIIQARYDINREFLEMMADVARQHGVQLILYVVPLNPRAENPYVPEQYAAFKAWLEELAGEKQIPFANLEQAVPAGDWGTFMGGPDFKHFKGAGHRLTARALLDHFEGRMLAAGRQGALVAR